MEELENVAVSNMMDGEVDGMGQGNEGDGPLTEEQLEAALKAEEA